MCAKRREKTNKTIGMRILVKKTTKVVGATTVANTCQDGAAPVWEAMKLQMNVETDERNVPQKAPNIMLTAKLRRSTVARGSIKPALLATPVVVDSQA